MRGTIEIQNLKKYYKIKEGGLGQKSVDIKAVDDVSISIKEGEIVGLVGESGSGKTTLARLILGLIQPTGGNVFLGGQNISGLSRRRIKDIRRNIAVVFQDPASNLNPRLTVEQSVIRPMIIHGIDKHQAKTQAKMAMDKVKMNEKYLYSYPHQLSGGQLQRIAIARALVLQPRIMVLDEPTSALDISIQAQVLNLLMDLQKELNLTYLIITHDLNVIRHVSEKIAVMYLGKLVEYGMTEQVFEAPIHPYTKGLISAAPVSHPKLRGQKESIMLGEPGSLINLVSGCRLAPRCSLATEICHKEMPELLEVKRDHLCACHHA